jgi:3-hydroxyisobutyrate dehydrogenase-like beta-hydroxyacid dehydrogenase
VKKIHETFAAKGAHMLDAPVSGAVRRGVAQDGDLGWRR